ncbi:protein phosphatase 2C domain-containing protein [Streptomyces sp. NPDC086023]|uniref:PP2C family protein-serine/threonine phosphatase n=1 Tax=Streptomyces sp. NPDC086023 TaxID=3365746 RepID=UPI0037D5BEF1
MSRMPWLSGCPSCEEPVEEGDRFCGRCGCAVTAAPTTDRPTVPFAPGAAPAAYGGRPPAAGGLPGEPAPAPGAYPGGPVPATGSHPGGPVPPAGGFPGGPVPRPGEPAPGAAATAHGFGDPSWPAHPAPGAGPTAYGEASGPGAAAYGDDPGGQTPGAGVPVPGEPRHDFEAPAPGAAPAPGPAAFPARPASAPAFTTPVPGTAEAWPRDGGPGSGGAYGGPVFAAGGGPGVPPRPDHAPTLPDGPDHPPTLYDGPGHGPVQVPAPPSAPPAPPAPAAVPRPAGARGCVACRSGHVDTDGYCENCGHAQPRERDHQEESLESVAAVSDRGLRHHRNEDSFAVAATALPDGTTATVAVVCDGVSSASRPDDASAAAASAANESLLSALPRGAHPQQAMHEAIVSAADAVNALAAAPGHQNAPACTLVGAVVTHGILVIGWVGDSRAYWVPDDRSAPPARLTEDDSWAAQMVAAGLMGEAEAYADVRAHAITGWLGADAYELEPHTAAFKPDRPGVVVVCTDGLWNYAESAEEMARVLPPDAATRPLHSAQVLVGHALDGGGHDNVTVAVVPFPVAPRPHP